MKREKYIDVAKGFGILLVVYGHVISNCDLRPDLTLIQKFIYSFHMPLFFFISGYCLGLRKDTGEKPEFLPQLKKISRNLLLPYFIWSGVYLFLSGKLGNLERLKALFTARGIAPIWFLGALALCEIAFVVLRMLTHKLNAKGKTTVYLLVSVACFGCAYVLWLIRHAYSFSEVTLGTTLFYCFLTVSRFMMSMPILLLGYIISQAQLIQKAGKLRSGICGGVLVGALCVLVYLTQLSTNFHLFHSSNLPVLMCTSILGSLGVLMLSYSLGDHSRFLNFFGVNSLTIMLVHYMPFKTIAYSNNIVRTLVNNPYLVSILATAIAMLISCVGVWLIKNKFFIYKNK